MRLHNLIVRHERPKRTEIFAAKLCELWSLLVWTYSKADADLQYPITPADGSKTPTTALSLAKLMITNEQFSISVTQDCLAPLGTKTKKTFANTLF